MSETGINSAKKMSDVLEKTKEKTLNMAVKSKEKEEKAAVKAKEKEENLVRGTLRRAVAPTPKAYNPYASCY